LPRRAGTLEREADGKLLGTRLQST
jgi:hypothetical protein